MIELLKTIGRGLIVALIVLLLFGSFFAAWIAFGEGNIILGVVLAAPDTLLLLLGLGALWES